MHAIGLVYKTVQADHASDKRISLKNDRLSRFLHYKIVLNRYMIIECVVKKYIVDFLKDNSIIFILLEETDETYE